MARAGVLVREGWRLVMTCSSCPEQYDVIDHQGETKAYLRLRHGYFNARCPDVGGDVVFEHTFEDPQTLIGVTGSLRDLTIIEPKRTNASIADSLTAKAKGTTPDYLTMLGDRRIALSGRSRTP